MEIIATDFKDLLLIRPTVFGDERGYFFESYNALSWEKIMGEKIEFVQDNESMSQKNVLRGLHFQQPPFAQGKLVRAVRGSVLDVVVDIRKSSPNYGQHFKMILSEKNKMQMFIPEGFAHGFLTLEDNTIFSYKCTNFYNKESEGGLMWNDENLKIEWGISEPILSEKDWGYKKFTNFATPFD